MPDWLITILVALIGSGIGTAAINIIGNRKKTDAEAKAITGDARNEAMQAVIEASKHMVDTMQERVNTVNARLDTLEAELQRRDMIIKQLTEENVHLKLEVDKLKQERDEQVKVNRSQGQRIHDLQLENKRLSARIRSLEVRLKELGGMVNDGNSADA
jgi:chromosome segregation ATPase